MLVSCTGMRRRRDTRTTRIGSAQIARSWREHARHTTTRDSRAADGVLRYVSSALQTTSICRMVTHHGTSDTTKATSTGRRLCPFGCLVDYLPKPEVLRALPKFEPRACQGIFVGHYLQPGGEWKGENVVFTDCNFEEPQKLTELHPARTMETKLIGSITFPMKAKYDLVKRSLPLTSIKHATLYDGGSSADLTPRETASRMTMVELRTTTALQTWGGAASSAGLVPSEGAASSRGPSPQEVASNSRGWQHCRGRHC